MITGSQKPGFSHLWVSYGFFYGFLWVFYGFLMGFYGFFMEIPVFFPILNPLWSNISAKTIYGVLSGPMVPHVACMDASEKEVQVPSHPEGNCRRGRGPPFERDLPHPLEWRPRFQGLSGTVKGPRAPWGGHS